MAMNAVRALWGEPRAPLAPKRVWRDWVLLALLLPTAVLEGVLRPDLAWRPVALVWALVVLVTLLWRRTHPLAVVAIAFGAAILSAVAVLVADAPAVGLNTLVAVVLLPYSLTRWGSGREVGIGLLICLVALVLGTAADYTGITEAVLGGVFLFTPAVLGAAVRYWAATRHRELDRMRLQERALLARELHDTVAHHVSAIAVRAQAGRVVAASHPEAAMEALVVIEAEASRTLAEMRVMVGALRAEEVAALSPQQGLAELERLAGKVGDGPRVEVELSGDLADLGSPVGAALYRIAQESVTNAARHARHATRIDVRVVGDGEWIRLTVDDDGDAGAAGPAGFGLIGMTERATLLGGSFVAGPGVERGWSVAAVLPRSGVAG
ncbi:sensor histidine kinase [Kribbella sp. CA-293567]|uniref:sensor histidine kinase n=1 Tax=Kribbella sp. CA-293567 TaxID=3002436 RepID=UPI0022DE2650|nr:histidine kinase [Kribbella sp. CA-293567]WBQ05982.1 histidine kinase [Kribbella sp. CA-293567]